MEMTPILGLKSESYAFPDGNQLTAKRSIQAEIEDPKMRELIVQSYRLIYEISSDITEIPALIRGEEDFFIGWLG